MHGRRVWLAALAALGAAAARSAELTDMPPTGGTGVERGVVLLRCAAPGSALLTHSRATVLDAGSARADVLLATAHALPPSVEGIKRDCRALARGKQFAIDAVWHAGADPPAPEHDWAVLLLAERIKGDIRRWPAAAVADSRLDELVASAARVRIVRRYAEGAETDCRLDRWMPPRLLAHTCITYPGESGSPIVIAADGALVLIGVHVGSHMGWNGARPDMISIARPLDGAVIVAVEAATARAAQDRRRRSNAHSGNASP